MTLIKKLRAREIWRRFTLSLVFLVPFAWNLVEGNNPNKMIGTGIIWGLAFCWPLIFRHRVLVSVIANNDQNLEITWLDHFLCVQKRSLPYNQISRLSIEKAAFMVRLTDELQVVYDGKLNKFRITHPEVLASARAHSRQVVENAPDKGVVATSNVV